MNHMYGWGKKERETWFSDFSFAKGGLMRVAEAAKREVWDTPIRQEGGSPFWKLSELDSFL